MFDGVFDRVGYFRAVAASNELGKIPVFFPVENPNPSVILFIDIGLSDTIYPSRDCLFINAGLAAPCLSFYAPFKLFYTPSFF